MLVGFLKASNNPEWNSVEYNHFVVKLTWNLGRLDFVERREVYSTLMSYPDCQIQKPAE